LNERRENREVGKERIQRSLNERRENIEKKEYREV
jgi:hypothetical protein